MSEVGTLDKDLAKAVHDLAETVELHVKDGRDDSAESKTQFSKMGEDIITLQRTVTDFEHVVSEKLDVLSEDREAVNAEIFDIHLDNKDLFNMWGYDNEITKVLYKPRTHYDRKQGWVKNGSYDGCEDLMQLNDFLFIASLARAGEKQDWANYSKYLSKFESLKLFNYELSSNQMTRKEFKALSSSGTNTGNEFVPTQLSARIVDDIRLALRVTALFPTVQLRGKGDTFEFPLRGARQVAYLMPESTTDDSSKIPAGTAPTDKISMSIVKHALRMLYSYEFEEDSLVAALPFVVAEITQALADGKEDSIINGDTSSTHLDSDVESAFDIRKSWNGLRKASGGSTGNGAVSISTWDDDAHLAMRKSMGRFGAQVADLAHIMSFNGFINTLKIDNTQTVDKYGQFAAILSGELGKLYGVPIIVSEFVRNDLTTAGIYDGATTTDTIILLVNRRAFWFGERSQLRQESDRDIETQQNRVVMSHRVAFKEVMSHGTGEESVSFGYNMTS